MTPLQAAAYIVETRRRMDAADVRDGFAHVEFENARTDHDTAVRLYAVQVAEALLKEAT